MGDYSAENCLTEYDVSITERDKEKWVLKYQYFFSRYVQHWEHKLITLYILV